VAAELRLRDAWWDDGRRREKKELKRGEETRRELREKCADMHLLEDGRGYKLGCGT
jgi:hypothetical protein